MSGQESAQFYTIEQNPADALAIADTILQVCDISIEFAAVERVPRYMPEKRENNAEHSFMLGLVASEVATQHFPWLDSDLVTKFALVHDLTELITGDVATFNISDDALQTKKQREEAALEQLCVRLPPNIESWLRDYEAQELPEARFVRFVDKHLPLAVDILGSGSQVMHEDYQTYTIEQLAAVEDSLKERFKAMFPEPEFDSLQGARDILADMFEVVFEPANIPETN